jgi:hypothetical protein
MTNQAIIMRQFKLYARIAELYKAGVMVLDERALDDPVEALAQFASGYAFERQGRSPSYGAIAGKVIRALAPTPSFWEDPDAPKRIWDQFCSELGGLPSNPKVNPLCCKGWSYTTKRGTKTTSQPSAVEFAQRLTEHNYNLVGWVTAQLKQDQVQDAHRQLCGINGIGEKIASFFLREAAWCFDVTPSRDRALLQPIDVWVRRAVERMDPTVSKDHREWIVEKSNDAGVLPEAVNAGLWYLGAIIAGSQYRLFEVLNRPEQAERLVNEHIERLERQVHAWRQG